MRKSLLPLAILAALSVCCKAQMNRTPGLPAFPASDTIPAKIIWTINGNEVHFSASLRPLRQLSGAPTCYYSYFWEFGDGSFSQEENPVHIYKNAGSYQVRLYATNYHDDGIAPPAKPYTIKIENQARATTAQNFNFFDNPDQNIKMQISRDPKPGEDFVVVIGYRNNLITDFSGTIAFFFNEREIKNASFSLKEKRGYNDEEGLPLNKLFVQKSDEAIGNKNIFAATSNDNFLHRINISNQQKKLLLHNGVLKYDYSKSNSNSLFANADFNPGGFLLKQKKAFDSNDVSLINELWLINPGVISSKKIFMNNFSYNYAGAATNYRSSTRSMLRLMNDTYLADTSYHFRDSSTNENHFLFLTMNTLPDMIQDTNTTVTITAMLIPDDDFLAPETVNLNMEIVASHDPNKLLLKNKRLSFRFFPKKKELNYEVHFQNTGKGPVRKVAIGFALPKQLNASTLQVKGIKPYCFWCNSSVYNRQSCIDTIRTADSIYFTFNNIYLPGIQQHLVNNIDSTKGFVQYSVKFKKKPKNNLPFSARAAIIFDKNEPIYTNRAIVRFAKELSPGIIAGYNLFPSSGSYSSKGSLQIGFTLSRYAASRPYFQPEFYGSILQKEDSLSGFIKDSGVYLDTYPIFGRENNTSIQRSYLQLVPLQIRYNFNNWIGIGAGVLAQFVITEKRTQEAKLFAGVFDHFDTITQNSVYRDTTIIFPTIRKTGINNFWDEVNAAPFIDLQVGRVKTTGPAIGFRYMRRLRGNLKDQFLIYGAFKL